MSEHVLAHGPIIMLNLPINFYSYLKADGVMLATGRWDSLRPVNECLLFLKLCGEIGACKRPIELIFIRRPVHIALKVSRLGH